MNRQPTRRDFLGGAAVAGLAFWAGGRAAAEPAPGVKLRVGSIGVSGKGDSDTQDLANGNEVIALCDIDRHRLDGMAQRFPGAKLYSDWRRMLEAHPDLDAVTISTPDHHHAPAALTAMLMGISTFVQKPMSHTAYEARLMRETAMKMGVCSQMGNQGTSSGRLREGVEVVKAGLIGGVSEIHIWTNRPVWPQGLNRPDGEDAVPDHIDWDAYIGPADPRPYKNDVYHPFRWRGWYDYGCGALGDMACHTMNLPFWAGELGYPTSIEKVDSSDLFDETFPNWSVLRYEFPARGMHPATTVYWYDGGKKPPSELFPDGFVPDTGSLMIGNKGVLVSGGDYGDNYRLLPEADFEAFEKPEPTIPRSPGHMEEFVQAIKAGDPTLAMSNFDYAGLLTEVVVLGNLALHCEHKIEWNGEEMTATNAPELAGFINKPYRAGWELPCQLEDETGGRPTFRRRRR